MSNEMIEYQSRLGSLREERTSHDALAEGAKRLEHVTTLLGTILTDETEDTNQQAPIQDIEFSPRNSLESWIKIRKKEEEIAKHLSFKSGSPGAEKENRAGTSFIR